MISSLKEISLLRLQHQHIAKPVFTTPKELVTHMGAMQAQDYEMSKYGIALRLKNGKENDVEESLNNTELIRTHILRPTWHIVSADDYRWMLDLSAPQLKKVALSYNKQIGLDEATLKKSTKIISQLLRNDTHLTRDEIMTELNKSKIETNQFRSAHIMFHAEINGLVCNGIRKGKQHTYALLDERVPFSKLISREEALSNLALNYFTSHAPAGVRDFAWWSGLTLGDSRKAIELIKPALNEITVDNKQFYFMQADLKKSNLKENTFLLPAFDEFLVSYTDRTAAIEDSFLRHTVTVNGIFKPVIVTDGQVTGLWKRTVKPKHTEIEIMPFKKMSKEMKLEIQNRFGMFSSCLNNATLKFL